MQLENLNTEAREWLPATDSSPVERGGGEGAKHETTIAANVAGIMEA